MIGSISKSQEALTKCLVSLIQISIVYCDLSSLGVITIQKHNGYDALLKTHSEQRMGLSLLLFKVMCILSYDMVRMIQPCPWSLYRRALKLMLLDLSKLSHCQRHLQISRIPAGDFLGHIQFVGLLWDPCKVPSFYSDLY